jgi:hypothetical protein
VAELDEIGLSRPAEIMLAIFLNMCRVLSVIPFIIFLAIWIPIGVAPWIIVGPWRLANKLRGRLWLTN